MKPLVTNIHADSVVSLILTKALVVINSHLLPQLKLYSDRTVKSNPSQYKYLVVGTGMTGIIGQYALSGRLASFLAHSGSVVILASLLQCYHYDYNNYSVIATNIIG